MDKASISITFAEGVFFVEVDILNVGRFRGTGALLSEAMADLTYKLNAGGI